ncbi:MAG: hypothetical protein ACU0CA_16250 [Paracoccaceae bacterium]
MSGNFQAIIDCYKEVVPVFIEGKAVLIDGCDAMRNAIENLRDRLQSEGVTRITGTLAIDEKMGNGRFRFSIDWQHYNGVKVAPQTSTVVYYCAVKNSQQKIEMVEYKRLAFPNIIGWKWLGVTAKPANNHVVSGYLH